MDLLSIILIALALSMDAFAVSVATGLQETKHAYEMSFSFGFFQAVMPILGWLAGSYVRSTISSFDHWIAFAILSAIGIKMIYEEKKIAHIRIDKYTIFLLSIATSIDAFAIGITLSFIGLQILLPAIIIGMVTFFVCLLGFLIAGKIKVRKAKVAGGIILIFLAIKILIEHSIQ